MKSLIIYGSPRHKKSASYHIGENFAKGLVRGGSEIDEIMLCKQKINHCLGCFTCWTKTPGICVHKDDMRGNLEKFREADLIVYTFPLYIYNVPGLIKDFMDRLIPLYEPYLIEKDGVSSHPKRAPFKDKDQKIFLISVAGFPELSHFEILIKLFKKLYKSNEYIGEILIGGAEMMSKDDFQDSYRNLYKMVEQGGYELAKNGVISEETRNLIAKESYVSKEQIETFREIANKYWDSFRPKDYGQIKLEATGDQALKLTDGGIATFFAGMATSYNSNALPGLKAVLQFNLDDKNYYLMINENECKAYKGVYPEPTLSIISPMDIWMKISTGEMDGAKTFLNGLFKVKGDMNILLNMDKIFSKPEISNKEKEKISPIEQKDDNTAVLHEKPLKLTDTGMAAFFAGMAKQYNPKIIPDLNATLQFRLEKENYYLNIKDNDCKAFRGMHQDPSITIITSADVWMKISSGELDGAKAYLKKQYKIEGDMSLLLKMKELFSKDRISDEGKKNVNDQVTTHNFDKIPQQRGSLKIPNMLWLNIAFVPWMILWIWGSISPGLLPQIIVAIIASLITLYHIVTNRPTLFEAGTCIYLISSAVLYSINLEFFMLYSRVINYIFLGGLWLGSLNRYFCLTAEYSRHDYPKALWGTRAFLETNNIICSAWGLYFLCIAILNLIMIDYKELVIMLILLSYLSLIPMFAFTIWFQKWYPAKIMNR